MPEHAARELVTPAPAEPAAAPAAPAPVTTVAGLAALRGRPGMSAALARAAAHGLGNQAVGRILARSALSDELQDVFDTQGEAALIVRLRTLGVSDPDVDTLVASLLSGDALKLGTLLVRYGDESMWPAPVEQYQTPFDDAPQSSPGERIIMNGRYLIVPDAVAHYHELVYTASAGGFDTATGGLTKTFTTGTDVNRIDTGNLSYFLPDPFAGTDTVTVTAEIRIRSTGAVVHTRTWTYTPRDTAPTEVTQQEPDTEVAIGSVYTYDVGPPLIPLAAPWYEHQTVLEEFAARTSNLDVADMDPAWLTAEGITDKAGIDAKLFSGSSNNGTFVVDADDRFYDRHGGGQATLDEAASHLAAPKDVWVDLPQVYTAGPGNVLGNFVVRRNPPRRRHLRAAQMEGLSASLRPVAGPRPTISLAVELAWAGEGEWTGTVLEPVVPWDLRAWVDGRPAAVRQPALDLAGRPHRLRLAPGARVELPSPIVLAFEPVGDDPFVWVLDAPAGATVELEASIEVSGEAIALPRATVQLP